MYVFMSYLTPPLGISTSKIIKTIIVHIKTAVSRDKVPILFKISADSHSAFDLEPSIAHTDRPTLTSNTLRCTSYTLHAYKEIEYSLSRLVGVYML